MISTPLVPGMSKLLRSLRTILGRSGSLVRDLDLRPSSPGRDGPAYAARPSVVERALYYPSVIGVGSATVPMQIDTGQRGARGQRGAARRPANPPEAGERRQASEPAGGRRTRRVSEPAAGRRTPQGQRTRRRPRTPPGPATEERPKAARPPEGCARAGSPQGSQGEAPGNQPKANNANDEGKAAVCYARMSAQRGLAINWIETKYSK